MITISHLKALVSFYPSVSQSNLLAILENYFVIRQQIIRIATNLYFFSFSACCLVLMKDMMIVQVNQI